MAAGDILPPHNKTQLLGSNATRTRAIGCNADGMLTTHPFPGFGITQDLTLNDTDKTFTVPAGKTWIVHWLLIRFAATATVGTRSVILELLDTAGNILSTTTGSIADIVASEIVHPAFIAHQGLITTTVSLNDTISLAGPIILPAAYQLRPYERSTIDANDDMFVTIGRQEIDNT